MMRDIKFRAWFKEQKIMSYFGIEASSLGDGAFGKEELKEIEVMQFTGLLDKNGKEIYEGDIVKHSPYACIDDYKENEHWKDMETIVIKDLFEFLENKGYAEGELGESYETKNLEIIGNVYENPGLLEEEA